MAHHLSKEVLVDIDKLSQCEQCGECSSACPLTEADIFNIRRILRHVELGLTDEIAGTAQPWICTTCGRCETACPNGVAILEIVRTLRAMVPEGAVDDPPRCIQGCPAAIDVPGYLRLIAQQNPHQAYELILQCAPFPGVLGRICPHPCESVCRRAEVNQSVAICALKRFVADRAGEMSLGASAVDKETGRTVAIVGAGPAGLTAAFFLRKKGHSVTVFEGADQPGGMLRYGVPRFRLPTDVLDKEIDQVLSLGIELKSNARLGVDIELDSLNDEHDAVFLALGLQNSRRIPLDGADNDGVLWGIEFLRDVAQDKAPEVKENLVVIGGGDVAVDVALTARRLGAKQVTMICLESADEMPAHTWEIDMARDEGIDLLNSWGPERIVVQDGKVCGVDLVRCTAVFDAHGAFNPSFSDEHRHSEADQVILAVGQTSDFAGLSLHEIVRDGLAVVNDETLITNRPGVFAGGEMATGPGSMVDAIAQGKRAAASIDRFLGGDGVLSVWVKAVDDESYDGAREKGFADRERPELPLVPVDDRKSGFCEVEGCLSEDVAVGEARRCFQCDLELKPERLLER